MWQHLAMQLSRESYRYRMISKLVRQSAYLDNGNTFPMVPLSNVLACVPPIRQAMERFRHKSNTCAFQLYCELSSYGFRVRV